MANIIIAPEVLKATVQIQGIFSVHREDADLECNCPQRRGAGCGGIEVAQIPLLFRKFELLCKENADRFIERMAARGRVWNNTPILLHGPWPTRVGGLSDIDSSVWDSAMQRDKSDGWEHPERALAFVQDARDAYVRMDYVLLAEFELDDIFTDLEVPSGFAVS